MLSPGTKLERVTHSSSVLGLILLEQKHQDKVHVQRHVLTPPTDKQ